MKLNVGGTDRILRGVIGGALVAATMLGYIGVWGWVGAVLLFTAIVGWCPPYSMLGINTRKNA